MSDTTTLELSHPNPGDEVATPPPETAPAPDQAPAADPPGASRFWQRWIAPLTILALIVLNLAIIWVNADQALAAEEISGTPMLVLATAGAAVLGYFGCLIPVSLVLYFAAAALHQGFSIQLFTGIMSRCLVWMPILAVVNLALELSGHHVASLGIWPTVLYAPMYALAGRALRRELLACPGLTLTPRQATVLTAIGCVVMIAATARF
jgi:hypothetical protein